MMMKHIVLLVIALLCSPCRAAPAQVAHLAWTRNANIYEVNIRQYTPEGTIVAFERQLPRLQKMGVKILWIMPVQPIGVKERKGSLGSYYSIRDYKAVNPEFGSQADFNRMVKTAHKLGMKVILDWVANHTAWDNVWVGEHPEWYKKNAKGEIGSYEYNNGREVEYWTDVVGLDYRQPALWDAMIAAMRFWVVEADVDGFRCDVASLVPTPFWQRARTELEALKPLFMLAESDDPAIHTAFDMTYNWKLSEMFADVARGKADVATLRDRILHSNDGFPDDAYRMVFTTNHDANSWRWSDKETYGEKFKAFAVLAATLPGMPLVYSGQESGLDKKIAFFEKDAIDWKTYENVTFYQKLLKLKTHNPALRNGAEGGAFEFLPTDNDKVIAYSRKNKSHLVEVFVNLSPEVVTVRRPGKHKPVKLEAWGYRLTEQ
jgi:glycosidase